jgi:hypothetical protein
MVVDHSSLLSLAQTAGTATISASKIRDQLFFPNTADPTVATVVNSLLATVNIKTENTVNLSFTFNTIYNGLILPAPSDVGITFENNIITTTGTIPIDCNTGCMVQMTNNVIFPASVSFSNNIYADPRFVNAASDFHLQATSPAVDAADASPAPALDLDGEPRPVGPRADLGAYEFHP